MKNIQASIGKWQNETFGTGPERARPVMRHLAEEVNELEMELFVNEYKSSPAVEGEMADCVILLIAMAESLGVCLESAVEAKMVKNRARTWRKPDANGVIRHQEGS